MYRSVSNGGEGRDRTLGRPTFQDTLQPEERGTTRTNRGQGGGRIAPTQANAENLQNLIKSFLDILRALSAKLGGDQGGKSPLMPVEPDGGIGDGAGPPPFIVDSEERFPVEPDGGIGDGARPPEVTTLALGEEDGGAGLDPLIDIQDLPMGGRGGIPFNDIAAFGRLEA